MVNHHKSLAKRFVIPTQRLISKCKPRPTNFNFMSSDAKFNSWHSPLIEKKRTSNFLEEFKNQHPSEGSGKKGRQRVSSYRPFTRTYVGQRWPPCCRTTLVERTRSNHKMVPTIHQPPCKIWMTILCLDETDSHNLLCDVVQKKRIKIYKLVHCYFVFYTFVL